MSETRAVHAGPIPADYDAATRWLLPEWQEPDFVCRRSIATVVRQRPLRLKVAPNGAAREDVAERSILGRFAAGSASQLVTTD